MTGALFVLDHLGRSPKSSRRRAPDYSVQRFSREAVAPSPRTETSTKALDGGEPQSQQRFATLRMREVETERALVAVYRRKRPDRLDFLPDGEYEAAQPQVPDVGSSTFVALRPRSDRPGAKRTGSCERSRTRMPSSGRPDVSMRDLNAGAATPARTASAASSPASDRCR